MIFLDSDVPTTTPSGTKVSCGNHEAASCTECPKGNGAGWCNGVCMWQHNECVPFGKHVTLNFETLGQFLYY